MNLSFTAIDFETATGYMESACAVGIVTVTDGVISDEYYSLIQPPENEYALGTIPRMTRMIRIRKRRLFKKLGFFFSGMAYAWK